VESGPDLDAQRLRKMLVANLEKVGVRGEEVPPQLLF
jgi:hypothetical protein